MKNIYCKRVTVSAILVISLILNINSFAQELPEKIIVGYWHNWYSTWPNSFVLTEVPDAYDVINIAFTEPTVYLGSTMQFTPDVGIYPNPDDFIADVSFLQSQGKTVLISIGGANGAVNLNDAGDVDSFVSTMTAIIDQYGFDGMDIDLEGASLNLVAGDDDFRNPTSPLIVNFIDACNQLCDYYGPDFILTAAPETAYVQGGYSYYGSYWGAYLPVIHALRDRLTYIHVQHYNTGSMYGPDGNLYQPATTDFHVAMAEALLAGFYVDIWGGNIFFDPLLPEQVAIGLPAGANAAGSGYTEPPEVLDALDYIILGNSFGGQYQLADPRGYYDFRGLMTWSINWDVHYNNQFAGAYRDYLDSFSNSQIELSVSSLVFDTTMVTESDTLSFIVSNTGNADLIIYGIQSNIPDVFEIGWNPEDTLIASAAELEIEVVFIPQEGILYQDEITILNNDDEASVSVEGLGIPFNSVGNGINTGPAKFVLHPAHPNPFNPSSAIKYELQNNGFVKLAIYDSNGREVATLVEGWMNAGTYETVFNGADLSSGIYFARLQAGNFVQTQKLMLVK